MGATAGLIFLAAATTTVQIAMQPKPQMPKIPIMPDLPKAPDLAPLDAQQSRRNAMAAGQRSTILTGPNGLGTSPNGSTVLGSSPAPGGGSPYGLYGGGGGKSVLGT